MATPTVTRISELTEEFSVCTSGTIEENLVDVGKSRHKKICWDQNCVATTEALGQNVPTFGCRGDMSPTHRQLSQPSRPRAPTLTPPLPLPPTSGLIDGCRHPLAAT